MEQSVLNMISLSSIYFFYDGWRNGKSGSITQKMGIYRFYEKSPDSNDIKYVKDEDNPIVAKGIVSYWLQFNSRANNILKKITRYREKIPETIKEQFDNYTQMRFEQFKAEHRDDPDAWDWDWDYEFYAKTIIPHEMKFNKESEALFAYISDDDVKLVRSVMGNYIKYLRKCRSDRGYEVNPVLMVLRAADTQNMAMLEDLNDDEVNDILDKLSRKEYVHAARIEGHYAEAFRILPQGKAYLKHLEKSAKTAKEAILSPAPVAKESEGESENLHVENWDDRFDGFLHPNLNPQAIKKALDTITHTHFPKNKRSFWWVFVTVINEINWLNEKNYKLVLQWANLHFNCGWDWDKANQFKFSNVNKTIRKTQPSSKWNRSLTKNLTGDYYGELAKTMKETFVDIVNDGKMIDKSQFIKSGCTRINNGR